MACRQGWQQTLEDGIFLKVAEQWWEATRVAVDAACDWITQHYPELG